MKKFILPILILLFTVSTFAQSKRERIKALKVAHITTQINLTEKEAQEFWPIYNAYDDNISKIRREDLRTIYHEFREKSGTLTEKESNDLLERFLSAENKIHIENTQLVEKLRNVIPSQKIIQLKVAEEEFNRKILEQMKNMREKGMNKDKP